MPTEHVFADAADAAAGMAESILGHLTQALEARGRASLALSGGRSPRAVLERLSRAAIDWDKVTVLLVDDRWVDPSSDDSNEKLVREALLQNAAAGATFVPMKNDAADPYAGLAACEAAYAAIDWPIDVVVLGMGEDGHTASLFPGAAELAEGLSTQARVLAVTPPVAPHMRMSLSASAILSSRVILLQLSGTAKRDIYARALSGGPVEELPVRVALCQDAVPVEVWMSA